MTGENGRGRLVGRTACWTAIFMATCAQQQTAWAQWPGWGGPRRDFRAEASGLSERWPADGPQQLWSRKLGAGFSGIAVDDGALYTMYRDGDKEVTVALDAQSGKTRWEAKVDAPVPEGMETRFGKGPNATPLVHGDRLYTLGVAGQLTCLTVGDGRPRWTHDLPKEFGAKVPGFGFSASPLLHDDLLIVAAGGVGAGVLAFDATTGALRWKNFDYGADDKTGSIYSSPIVIDLDGEPQGVLLTGVAVIGFDLRTGDLRWKYPHENQWKTNISTPVWGDDNLLYVTAGGEAGSRGLKLTRSAGKTVVQQVWAEKKMGIGQGNVVRVGDHVFGSGGGPSAAFLTSANVKTGEIGIKERGFAKSMMLHADGKFILLDEDGKLALIKTDGKTLSVLAEKQLLKKPAWTIPTLVGKTLYLRDTEVIMALDLSAESTRGT